MLRILIIIGLIIYVGIISIWCYRFPISYKLTNGTSHALVVDHDFTEKEREGVEKAYHIRLTLSNVLIIGSISVAVASYIALHRKETSNKEILRVVMYVAGLIALILLLVDGIHFIPGPPIR